MLPKGCNATIPGPEGARLPMTSDDASRRASSTAEIRYPEKARCTRSFLHAVGPEGAPGRVRGRDERLRGSRLDRPREEVALAVFAAELHQGRELIFGLHSFGDHLEAEVPRQRHDRPDQLVPVAPGA